MPATVYTPEIADQIINRLIEGESLRQICSDTTMPGRMTVLDWLESEDKVEFRAKYARARELQADHMDDLILETANNSKAETAQADRVKIAAYQWRAEKLKPKVYGQKSTTELTGADGKDLQFTDNEAAAKLAAILEAAAKRRDSV